MIPMFLITLSNWTFLEINFNYTMTPGYDNNGNEIYEHFSDGRPVDSIFVYGLDNQLLMSSSETKHTFGN